jgi:hypothetical protein
MTADAIKEAIAELPPEQKASLAAWLIRDLEGWDKQIEEDFSPGGRGMPLLEHAEADVWAGRTQSMDDLLAEAKARRKQQKTRS